MSSILGVIGGMGPEATALFYEEVIAHTKAEKDQEHIDMVILSHDVPPQSGQILVLFQCRILMNEVAKMMSA